MKKGGAIMPLPVQVMLTAVRRMRSKRRKTFRRVCYTNAFLRDSRAAGLTFQRQRPRKGDRLAEDQQSSHHVHSSRPQAPKDRQRDQKQNLGSVPSREQKEGLRHSDPQRQRQRLCVRHQRKSQRMAEVKLS